MTKAVFDQISDGLKEALAVTRGLAVPFAFHEGEPVDVAAIRRKADLSLEDFAARFGFDPVELRDWEDGKAAPLHANRAYLVLIDNDPEHVLQVLARSATATRR